MIRNPFQSADGAARYAAGRPYLHPLFMEQLRPLLSGCELGADVACGTGLGSVALAEVVGQVVAFDASAAMLAHAAPHPRVVYALAPAEALPLPDACLDVLSVAQGIHWFDRPRFFAEARRTLKPGGVLFVYDMFFLAHLEGQPAFTDWMHQQYGVRYPPPPRWPYKLDAAQAQAEDFSFVEGQFDHVVPFSRPQVVAYLMTHSNTVAVSDEGRETPQEIATWLGSNIARFLPDGAVGQFMFGGLWRALKRLV
ncbi:class I SAM-dependent methyltransferase [Deinococcus ruber]|uniref:Methyltransferase type 11 n=1 Tax=Deinococcus ruber TaxID=1848197 RepID=A0A918C5S7_9DEIO|nr:class I SAM-dependent methyltransferase [Deinococcus ruber]GGR08343.1 methyltransferase type 11 [Deinococcus ruber]